MSPIERKERSNLRIPLTESEEALTRNLEVMKMEETIYHEEWTRDRELAEEMKFSIPGLMEEFVIDFITRGDGGCFVTAILQQLRRPEVNCTFSGSQPAQFRMMRQTDLRRKVFHFLSKSSHHIVQEWRNDFSNKTGGKSWTDYWSYEHMLKASFWVDEIFIRGTAWFLNRDIIIHQDRNPTIRRISGNMENENVSCPGPELHVAYLFNRHYQSILPKREGQGCIAPSTSMQSNASQERKQNQTEPSPDLTRCPACKKELKSVVQHINRSIVCQKKLGDAKILELKSYAEKISTEKKKEQNKHYQANFVKRKKELDPASVKASINERQSRFINKRRELDPEALKAYLNEKQTRHINKKRELNPEAVKASQNERQSKRRRRETSSERLRVFLETTLFAADFICISCHQRHFKSNVQQFNTNIISKIKMRLEDCIEDLNLHSDVGLSKSEIEKVKGGQKKGIK